MYWYLTITPPAGQPAGADKRRLVEFLGALPELRQTGPVAFGAAPGCPWVAVILAKTRLGGGYACDESFVPQVDIMELVCSDSGDAGWYDALAQKVAAFLGWVAVEEHAGRQVWPSLVVGHAT